METRETSLRKNTRGAEVYSDTHTEYILPDYLGEIKKILTSSAEIRPAAKYSSDDGTESSGIVVYDVLYTDSEGKLSSASFTSDYDLTLPRIEGGESMCLDSRIVNFAIRPAGPRKLSAHATVAASDIVSVAEQTAPEGTAFAEGREPELLTEDIELLCAHESERLERELAETILRLDGSISEEVSVISSRAEAECESVSLSGGEATVKGAVTVYAIIKNGDGEPFLHTHRLPFCETVAHSGEGETFGYASVSSLTTSVTPDELGCEIVASAIVDISVRSLDNLPVKVVTDAYLCECECENSYRKLSYTELNSTARERINHTASLSRGDEGVSGFDELLMLVGTPRISVTADGDKLSVFGTLKYTGAATSLSDSGERSYMPLKLEFPIEEKISLDAPISDGAKIEVRATCLRPTLTLDSECMHFNSVLDISFVITEDKSVTVLEYSMAGESREAHSAAVVTVYYPEPTDTLFSVARAHHTRVAKLAHDNSLTESVMAGGDGTLAGVKKLIIY